MLSINPREIKGVFEAELECNVLDANFGQGLEEGVCLFQHEVDPRALIALADGFSEHAGELGGAAAGQSCGLLERQPLPGFIAKSIENKTDGVLAIDQTVFSDVCHQRFKEADGVALSGGIEVRSL